MGMKGVVVVVPQARVADLVRVGLAVSDERVDPSDGMLDTSLAVIERPGGLVLVSGWQEMADAAERLTPLGTVHVAAFMSTVDYLSWRVVGADGERRWQSLEGDVTSMGSPHPAESRVDELTEDTLWELLERATGLPDDAVWRSEAAVLVASPGSPDWPELGGDDDHDEAPVFIEYDWSASTGPASPPSRLGRWRRLLGR